MKLLAITTGSLLLGIALGSSGTLMFTSRAHSPVAIPVVAERRLTPAADPRSAVEALRALRSVTQAGVTYQHYSSRVGDTKIEVDRYLRAAPDSHQRNAIDLAMRYYVAASTAWTMTFTHRDHKISSLAPKLGDDPRLSQCSIIKNIREDKAMRDVFLVALNIPPFWDCAAEQVAMAEGLL